MNRKLILIFGMHRSGTSAMAGSFYHAGYNLGNYVGNKFESIDGKTDGNEKGHFEDSEIVAFNTNVLMSMNTDWHLNLDSNYLLPYLPSHPSFSEMVVQLKEIIKRNFKYYSEDNLVYKDPRISVLLPIYYQAVVELRNEKNAQTDDVTLTDVYFIVMTRDRLEIAQSLNKRNPELISIEQGLNLTDRYFTYMNDSIRNGIWGRNQIQGYNPLLYISDFKKFINDPIDEINKISSGFGFDILDTEEKIKSVEDFIDPKLRRNRVE